MQSKLTLLALAIALVALGISAYGLTRDSSQARDRTGSSGSLLKVAELEERVDQLTAEIRDLRFRPQAIPAVGGRAAETARAGNSHATAVPAAAEEKLKAIVDEAVEEKARAVSEEMRIKTDKDPSFEDFAAVLELDDEQRAAIEQEVIRGQREVFGILEIRTEKGENLLDELVETYAASIAEPDSDPGWGKWIGKVLTREIPGTNETYAARVDAVKKSMNQTFKRVMTKEQFTEYARWGVDPVEIEDIEGSPGDALGDRIMERARELGAEIPEEDD